MLQSEHALLTHECFHKLLKYEKTRIFCIIRKSNLVGDSRRRSLSIYSASQSHARISQPHPQLVNPFELAVAFRAESSRNRHPQCIKAPRFCCPARNQVLNHNSHRAHIHLPRSRIMDLRPVPMIDFAAIPPEDLAEFASLPWYVVNDFRRSPSVTTESALQAVFPRWKEHKIRFNATHSFRTLPHKAPPPLQNQYVQKQRLIFEIPQGTKPFSPTQPSPQSATDLATKPILTPNAAHSSRKPYGPTPQSAHANVSTKVSCHQRAGAASLGSPKRNKVLGSAEPYSHLARA